MSVTIYFLDAPEELMLNLSNHNFYSFFNRLGLEAECCGQEKATVIYNLCKSFKPKTLIEDSYNEGNFYHCGRSLEQVTRYKWALMKLATEAIKQGKDIYWS